MTISGKVFSLNKSKLSKYINDNIYRLVFSVLFLIGVIIGLLNVVSNKYTNALISRTFNGLIALQNSKFIFIFLTFLFFLLIIDAVYFSLSTSLFGIVLLPVFYLTLSYFAGCLLNYSIKTYGLKGIAFNAIILLPPIIAYIYGLLSSSGSSYKFSVILSKILVFKNNTNNNIHAVFSEFCQKHSILLVFSVISALIYATFNYFFYKYFTF